MRKHWEDFIYKLKPEPTFIYRSEARSLFPEADFPAVFRQTVSGPELLIEAEQITAVENIDELIALVNRSLTKD